MGEANCILKQIKAKLSISRRSFIKGIIAFAATSQVYGCSKNNDNNNSNNLTQTVRYGTSAHNCGGRCLIKAHVKNGRITRFVTDESTDDLTGSSQNHNNSKSIACPKCRSYKFRLYHPGRLKYPLKQTIKRGDLTGFVKITWQQALSEIVRKQHAITQKYGNEAVYLNYACGNIASEWQGGGYTGIWAGLMNDSVAGRLLGGFTPYENDYSFHQHAYMSIKYTGYIATDTNADHISKDVKNIVLWGSNILSTVNPNAYPWIKSIEEMKIRSNTGKVTFIGPEFVDTGVTLADRWIQIKPYTDPAVILGMIYHLIDSTFNIDGTIKANPLLDLDYIDTMVYGFFDSPEYWIKNDTREITLTNPNDTVNYTKVNAVPSGKSLSAYIMGDDDRVTKAAYGNSNYIAKKFTDHTAGIKRNLAVCSYTATAGAATDYQTKLTLKTKKTPAWASMVSGVPENIIKELAELYAKPENHPIYNEWSGGFQKQANGTINFFILEALLILTKCWGESGNSLGRSFGSTMYKAKGSLSINAKRKNIPKNIETPSISCTMWHNGVKFAFGDQLKTNGYTAQHIPDLNINDVGTGKAYMNDAGTKSLLKWDRDTSGKIKEDPDGYYIPEKDGNGNLIYSGIRFIINPAGNILINQHMNSNDSREMFENLPIASTNPDDSETLCIVSFDNFLSPTPRWSDYVLPAATTWEQEDLIPIVKGNTLYIPVVSAPPGEAKSTWNITNEYLKAYESIDPTKSYISTKFTYDKKDQQIEEIVKDSFETARNNPSSAYFGKSWKDFINNPYIPKTPGNSGASPSEINPIKNKLKDYLINPNKATTPFAPKDEQGKTLLINTYSANSIGYGDLGVKYSNEALTTAPNESGRFHVYSDMLVWRYKNRYSKFHGYITNKAEQGELNIDKEGDPLVYPIPMYFAYEDYFMEAYGGKNLVAEPLLLTTTHDRYRVHSSMAESPYLRELTHRTRGGELYSGDDWNEYALLGNDDYTNIPRPNKAIADNLSTASWSEILINTEDANSRGIVSGDLVEVSNPIGKVRCIARVTNRCVKGMVGLHQGCWYDPSPADNVDDGGNCNTLMATRPSRIDHGNAQQSAMVSITKVI